jgi:hypothetical protein
VDLNAGSQLAIIIGTILAAAGLVRYHFKRIEKIERTIELVEYRLGRVERKSGALIEFLYRRGIVTAVAKGRATLNSPVVVTEEAKRALEPFRGELHEINRQFGHEMTDAELALEIEMMLGDRMIKEVCIPHDINDAECWVYAVSVARESTAEQGGPEAVV